MGVVGGRWSTMKRMNALASAAAKASADDRAEQYHLYTGQDLSQCVVGTESFN